MTKYLFIAVFVLSCALIMSLRSCREIQNERDRLSGNQASLLESIRYYRTADSLSAASVKRLTLTNKEFKQYCGDLEKTVESLNLKVKRLQSVSRTVAQTKYIVETVVRDSIIPGRTDTFKCIDYRDSYLTLTGCVSDKRFVGNIQSRDTIDQIIHRVPRRVWFIQFGCKGIRQEIVCRNPYSKIIYTKYIELKR